MVLLALSVERIGFILLGFEEMERLRVEEKREELSAKIQKKTKKKWQEAIKLLAI
jgi:hypothetical protein